MNKGEAAMRGEFERLLPTAGKGGFLISCDHQAPPGVSYQEYKLYIALLKEYAEKAGRISQEKALIPTTFTDMPVDHKTSLPTPCC